MPKQSKYVVKQYGPDRNFVAYQSKPMSEDAAYDHMSEMKGASRGQSSQYKWAVEPHKPSASSGATRMKKGGLVKGKKRHG